MKNLIPLLFGLTAAAFLLPALIALIKGEPARGDFIVLGFTFVAIAFMTLTISRARRNKSGGASGPPAP